jgi:alginate O-acetyltransferase complex protein AlgJ
MRAQHDPLALPRVPPAAAADHPRRDRIVASLFAAALAVPGLALFATAQRTTTLFENRAASPWPAPRLGSDFAPAFERAFADRFGGRDVLIQLHHAALVTLFDGSPVWNVMRGRDGWLYFLGEDGRSLDRAYRGVAQFPEGSLVATVAELVRRHDWLAARGIGYVVMVVPDKFTIYPEALPAWVQRSRSPTPHDVVTQALARDGRVHFIDLRAALTAAKARERVYYKTDSHWNFNGALVGYDALVREIPRVLPPGRPFAPAPPFRPTYVPGEDFYSGDLAQMLGVPRLLREDDVAPLAKVLADAGSRCARRVDGDRFPGFEFHECARPGLLRAVVLRDSMAIPLIPLLSENFARVIYVSSRKLDRDLIEREKPDVVIEELVERSLHAPGATPM